MPHEKAARLTVLLAEDDPHVRSMLAIVLRRDGHRVLESRDGAELADALWDVSSSSALDDMLVIADLQMPVMDSLTVLRHLAARGQRLPFFILLTTSWDAGVETAAAELGILAVLEKPFDVREFQAVVRSFAAGAAIEAV
jgi:CheY-like chemotaxis protein